MHWRAAARGGKRMGGLRSRGTRAADDPLVSLSIVTAVFVAEIAWITSDG